MYTRAHVLPRGGCNERADVKRIWTAIAVCLWASAARADLVVWFTQTLAKPAGVAAEVEVSCAHDRVTAHVVGAPSTAQANYIYRADLGVLWTVLPLWRAYVQQDDVTEIVGRARKNTAEDAEERILALPAAERPPAEAAEKARQAALQRAAVLQFTDSGRHETVAGVECAIWVAGSPAPDSTASAGLPEWRDEVSVAPWSVLGAEVRMPDALLDLSRTLEHWYQGTPAQGGVLAVLRALPALGGCPVRVRHYVGGELMAEYVFSRALIRDVTPGAYVIPPGFERRAG